VLANGDGQIVARFTRASARHLAGRKHARHSQLCVDAMSDAGRSDRAFTIEGPAEEASVMHSTGYA